MRHTFGYSPCQGRYLNEAPFDGDCIWYLMYEQQSCSIDIAGAFSLHEGVYPAALKQTFRGPAESRFYTRELRS